MPLTTPRLVEQLEYLQLLKKERLITSEFLKAEAAKLKKKQATIDAQNAARRAKREAAAAVAAQKKKDLHAKITYFKTLDKQLEDLSTKNIPVNVKLTNLPKLVELKDILDLIVEKTYKSKSILKAGDQYITLTADNRRNLLNALYNVFSEGEIEFDSWVGFVLIMKENSNSFTISNVVEKHLNEKWMGAWFKYNHTMDFDFTKFGIFKVNEPFNYENSCLVNSLTELGLESIKVEQLKAFVKDRNIPICKLEDICNKLEICIHLNKNDQRAKTIYGKKYDTIYNIGLIENHYFPILPVMLTSYAINHYNEIKDLKNWNSIYKKDGKYYERSQNRYITSFEAVKLLVENKDSLLVEIDYSNSLIATSQFYDKASDTLSKLEYDPKVNCIPVKCSKLEKDDFQNVFFDFETYLNKDNVHVPYLVCSYIGDEKKMFFGSYCAFNFLKSLKKKSRLIAHNANYDYRFLIKHLQNINELSRGNRLIGCTGKFFGLEIEIKDSYHLISKPLRQFPESFKLGSIVKEVMPYELYTEETIQQRYVNIQYVLDTFIQPEDKEQFLHNIAKWKLQKDDTYDIVKYSVEYCFIDCDILQKGYNIFRSWMLETVNIDINKIMTIASLAHRYFVNEGCYKDVNQLSGVPQLFIQGSVVGGRTMVSENKKIQITERINDFDAVSLYPSAMKRMDGFLKGIPKVIETKTYDFLCNQDGYFVDIIINSVGTRRQFPLMSYKNEEGIRMFSNDMVGKTMRVDKYTLEDLIQFHNITFTIERGYYFNEGFNNRINTVIEFLFNERALKKKQGNPIQEVYKLIMNSGYGKSIMKPVDSETKIFDDVDEFSVYLSRNYNWIKEFTYFGDKVKVKTIKTINDHFNIAHVGSMILSMSKRIMNEVMCSAEDNNIKLYYQDTDSIHIKDEDISKLSSIFKTKYNKELIGKNLGQFHSDFQLDGCKDIIANASIFLGKKCYIDRLEGIDKNGNKQEDYHIRMKGIPNSVILYTSKKLGYATPYDMYKDLYNGKAIEFDLTNDGKKCNFKMNKDYSVETLEVFKRVIKF